MKIYKKQNILSSLGFTLIELLVVISIIGLLSSVVMVNLKKARDKAKDAAVKQAVMQFSKLMIMEYDQSGSYANLQANGLINTFPRHASNCDGVFSGVYAEQARKICNNILLNAKPVWGSPGDAGVALLVRNAISSNTKFSITVSLNNGKWFCSGSSGTSDNTSYWLSTIHGDNIQSDSSRWPESPRGCYYNP